MIKAEELRIGNYVKSVRTGEIIPVDWIAIKCVHDGNTLPPAHGTGIAYEPIPITEEILLKCGFEKQVLSDNSAHYYTLELNENKYCNLSICSGDKNGFVEATLFPYEEWFRYKYVHQLQNLYFALTGEELEVKL